MVNVLLVVPPAIENPVALDVNDSPFTVESPAMEDAVPPKETLVDPIVMELLASLAFEIEPANMVSVTVPASPVVINVPVVAGSVIVVVPAIAAGCSSTDPDVDPGIVTLKIPVRA